MTSMMKEAKINLVYDYIQTVFFKLSEVEKNLRDFNLITCWRNLCQSGVMLKNWGLLY